METKQVNKVLEMYIDDYTNIPSFFDQKVYKHRELYKYYTLIYDCLGSLINTRILTTKEAQAILFNINLIIDQMILFDDVELTNAIQNRIIYNLDKYLKESIENEYYETAANIQKFNSLMR